jgi:hypothetical protein
MLLFLIITACQKAEISTFPSGPNTFVLQSDYATGALNLFLTDGDAVATHAEGDSLLRVLNGRVFLLQRSARDLLIELNPKTLNRLHEWPLSIGANPHDIALVGEEIWVTQYGSSELLRLDGRSGEARQPIDLSPFSDADGRPEMSAIISLEERVIVALQRIDFSGETPQFPEHSLLLSLTHDGQIIGETPIPSNPYGLFQDLGNDRILLTVPGDWKANNNLGKIITFSFQDPENQTVILKGENLAARPTLSLAVDDNLWVITDNGTGGNDLWLWNLEHQTRTQIMQRNSWDLACLSYDPSREVVWVCDRKPGQHGLLRFDRSGTVVEPRISTELAPTAVATDP